VGMKPSGKPEAYRKGSGRAATAFSRTCFQPHLIIDDFLCKAHAVDSFMPAIHADAFCLSMPRAARTSFAALMPW
jgi:hypothetical protein